jgi:hypothetical protein
MVSRIAYRSPGRSNVHPLDAALNLPEEKHSHGLRRLAACVVTPMLAAYAPLEVNRAVGGTGESGETLAYAALASHARDPDRLAAVGPLAWRNGPAGAVGGGSACWRRPPGLGEYQYTVGSSTGDNIR